MKLTVKNVMFIVAFFSMAMPAQADTRYKCEAADSVSYQYRPCPEGARQTVLEDPRPADPDQPSEEVDGVGVSDFSVKPTNQDSIGYQWFGMKVTVTNKTGQDKSVYLTYQAIDASGYEIEDMILTGKVRPGHTEILTDTGHMKIDDFKRIREWKLKK